MQNPVRARLELLDLTPRAFAVFNGLSLDTVRSTLTGKCRQTPAKIREALLKSGADVSNLDYEYATWLHWRAEEDVRQRKGACK